MKILIDIGHPAHVHLFKNMIWNLEQKGHEIKITARDKDVALQLLDAYELEYENRGKGYEGLFGKATGLMKINYRIYKIARQFKPDVLIGVHNPYIAQVGRFIRKPAVIFTDTEHAKLAGKLTFPFATAICTPSCFKKDLGKKQVKYNGYHELAYLHPKYFKPDSSVLEDLGLSKDDRFIIVRFVSWDASHDISDKGFTNTIDAVIALERYGKILITSEKKLPKKLEKYRITVPSEKIHHLLCFATLYIGESATMASESAILGTPSIFVSTSRRGYTDELEDEYGLVYTFSNTQTLQKSALEKAFELLDTENVKSVWREKRQKLLCKKIDVTQFMTDLIERYPESFYEQRTRIRT